jgi:hypothetical protein
MSYFIAFFDPFGTVVEPRITENREGVSIEFSFVLKKQQKDDDFLDLLLPDVNRRLVGVWDKVDTLRLDWAKTGVRLANVLVYFD